MQWFRDFEEVHLRQIYSPKIENVAWKRSAALHIARRLQFLPHCSRHMSTPWGASRHVICLTVPQASDPPAEISAWQQRLVWLLVRNQSCHIGTLWLCMKIQGNKLIGFLLWMQFMSMYQLMYLILLITNNESSSMIALYRPWWCMNTT